MSVPRVEPVRARTVGSLLTLQLLGVIAILTLPSLFFAAADWSLPASTIAAIACFGASFLICTAILIRRERAGQTLTAGALLGILALGYLPTLSFLLLAQANIPRRPLIAELLLCTALVCAATVFRRLPRIRAAILILAAVAGVSLQLAYFFGIMPRPLGPSVVTDRVNTNLYALKVTEYRSLFPKPKAFGGGIALLGDRYLLATGAGDLYVFSEAKAGLPLNMQRSPYRIPLNLDEFVAAAGTTVDTMMFRAADIAIQERDGRVRLFASHHYWKPTEKCFVERVSELEGDQQSLVEGRAGMTWRTIYETSPCVPIAFPDRQPYFNGAQAGGRLAFLGSTELLVTIGDNGLDGWSLPMSAPQDLSSSYGKTILIHLKDLSHETYSIGHRNPQGLVVAASGAIWLTEHGPQGGDELNLIERGGNYGWPVATYGAEYSTHTWPFDPVPGSHEGYAQPFYSWIPSIGISSVVISDSPQFKLWKDDLLVSSLADRAIYRMRIRENRVVMLERFPIQRRIRDIKQGHEGELLLWTDSATLMVVRAGADADTGEALFDACAGCHAVKNGKTHGFGPDLYKLIDRDVGSAEGFHYSPAMQALGGTWTKERLDAFLADPRTFAPGTAMQFNGLSDPTSRAKLIEFLASGKKRALGETVIPE